GQRDANPTVVSRAKSIGREDVLSDLRRHRLSVSHDERCARGNLDSSCRRWLLGPSRNDGPDDQRDDAGEKSRTHRGRSLSDARNHVFAPYCPDGTQNRTLVYENGCPRPSYVWKTGQISPLRAISAPPIQEAHFFLSTVGRR